MVRTCLPMAMASVIALTACVKPGLTPDEIEKRIAARIAAAETWGRATYRLSQAPYLAMRCPSDIGYVVPVAVTAFGKESGESSELRAAVRERFGRKTAVVVAFADGPAAGKLARGDVIAKIGRDTPTTVEDAVDALMDAAAKGRLKLETAQGRSIELSLEKGCALGSVVRPGTDASQGLDVRSGRVRVDEGFAARVGSEDAAAYLTAREIAYADPQLLRAVDRANSLRQVAQGYAQAKLAPSMPFAALPGGSGPVANGPAAGVGEGFGTLHGVRLADAAADLAATSLARQAGFRPQVAVETFARLAGDAQVTTPRLKLSTGRLRVTQKLAEADTRANLAADTQRMAREQAQQRAARDDALLRQREAAQAEAQARRDAESRQQQARDDDARKADEKRSAERVAELAVPDVAAVGAAAGVAVAVATGAPPGAPTGPNALQDALQGQIEKAGVKGATSLFAPAPVAGAIVIGRVTQAIALDSIALDDRYERYAERSASFMQRPQPLLTREQYRATVGGTGLLSLGALAAATNQQIDVDVPWELAGQLQGADRLSSLVSSASEGLLNNDGDLVVALAGDDGWPFVTRVLCVRADPGFDACAKRHPTGRFDAKSGDELGFDGKKLAGGRRLDLVSFEVARR
jgi:hypothetical protein